MGRTATLSTLGALCLTAWTALPVQGARFFTPVSVTSPNTVEFYPISRLHQGPGVGYSANEPHTGIPGQTWVTTDPGGYPSDYIAVAGGPVLVIDLGADRHLTEISTWGYTTGNNNGVSSFSLRFATAAEGAAGFGASLPGQGPFSALQSDTQRDSHPLTPVTARWVELTVLDNFYTGTGAGGGDRVGLGEIAFEDTDPIVIPPDAVVRTSQAALDFGVHPAATGVLTRSLTVRNDGAADPLHLASITVAGPDAARFTVGAFPAEIAAGAAAELPVSLETAGPSGCLTAWLEIASDDAARPLVRTGLLAAIGCTPPAPEEPTFSVAAGTFADDFALALGPAAAGTLALHTTDGSLPSWENGQPFTGPFTVARTTLVRALTVTAGATSDVRSAGYVRLSAAVKARTSPLPILILENFGAGPIPDKGWTTSTQTGAGLKQVARQPTLLTLLDRVASTGRATLQGAAAVSSRAGTRVRGAFSSTWFPKPYSLETWDEADDGKGRSLLGMAKESDWVLYHPHPSYDATMIFNTYIWELSRLTGRWAPDFRYVEVWVNEDGGDLDTADRRGLYALVEQVKRDPARLDFEPLSPDGSTGGWRLAINRMDPEPVGGFPAPNGATSPQFFRTAGPNRLLQTSANNPAQVGDDIPRQYNAFINFEDPGGYDVSAAQRGAIEAWFRQFEDALYDGTRWRDPVNGYRQHLDTRDFIDYFQLLNLARQGDGLLLSMYPWVSSADRKLRMGPMWDFNNGSYHLSGSPTTTLYFRQDQLWYPRLFADPDFLMEYIDRWFEMRRGPYAATSLAGIADRLAADITQEMATAQGVSAATWTSRLASMKNFLVQRADWIDTQYVRPPALSPAGGVHSGGVSVTLSDPGATGGTFYLTTDGSDPRAPGGAVHGTAQSGPLTLSTSAEVKARVRTPAGTWSGLVSATYIVGTPASAADVVISELHYNPAGAGDAGEFLELMNIGSAAVDLTGAVFDHGVQVTFPTGTVLAPGERGVIVASSADFPAPGPRILAEFAAGSRLDNGGERLRLLAWDGSVIADFTWDDVAPWPTVPDGDGPSLTLVRPHTRPDYGDPANWRHSVNPGGTPGGTDAVAFTGVATADTDGDGLPDLCEHAFGGQLPELARNGSQTLWRIPVSPAAEDVEVTPEWSPDLRTWQPIATLLPDAIIHTDGTIEWHEHSGEAPDALTPAFLRVRVTLR